MPNGADSQLVAELSKASLLKTVQAAYDQQINPARHHPAGWSGNGAVGGRGQQDPGSTDLSLRSGGEGLLVETCAYRVAAVARDR